MFLDVLLFLDHGLEGLQHHGRCFIGAGHDGADFRIDLLHDFLAAGHDRQGIRYAGKRFNLLLIIRVKKGPGAGKSICESYCLLPGKQRLRGDIFQHRNYV